MAEQGSSWVLGLDVAVVGRREGDASSVFLAAPGVQLACRVVLCGC